MLDISVEANYATLSPVVISPIKIDKNDLLCYVMVARALTKGGLGEYGILLDPDYSPSKGANYFKDQVQITETIAGDANLFHAMVEDTISFKNSLLASGVRELETVSQIRSDLNLTADIIKRMRDLTQTESQSPTKKAA